MVNTVIIPLQDVFCLDSEAKNEPSWHQCWKLEMADVIKINWNVLDWDKIEIEIIKERPYTHPEAVKTIAKAIKDELT